MKQLSPNAVWLFFIGSLFRVVVSAVILVFYFIPIFFIDSSISSDPYTSMKVIWSVIGVFLLVMLLAWIWAKLSYRYYKYELREDGFRKESGVIFKKYVTVPYDRIQNVDINRGLLARMLGLSDLQIQTAGYSQPMKGMSSEGRLPGISHTEAELLRDELIARTRSQRNSQGL